PVQLGSGAGWFAADFTGVNNYSGFGLRRPTIAAGTTSGYLFGFGTGTNGNLGQNDTAHHSNPIQIGTSNAWAHVAGAGGTFLVGTNGTLWACGDNSGGNLGDGTVVLRSSPVQIGSLTDWSKVYNATSYTNVAIKTDGTLWGWGVNDEGQVGDGSTTARSSPVQVGALTTWSKANAGDAFGAAIKTDGTLWMWGAATEGELGQGNTTSVSSPVKVGSQTDWATVSCHNQHVLATKTTGKLYAWGANNYGGLGLNDTANRSSPVQVGSLTDWGTTQGQASGGNWHSHAVKSDGTLWSWGINEYGQTGHNNAGSGTYLSSPVQVGTLTDWSTLMDSDGTGLHMCAIKTDGTLWSMGKNTNGRLGNNSTANASSPVQVGHHTDWQMVSGTSTPIGIRKAYK
ncbi:MAG: hypothetical protein QF535_12800, partial [Anaerolineales bacterium]|nr:hypothetical protein [Anaerolineales bacterium]